MNTRGVWAGREFSPPSGQGQRDAGTSDTQPGRAQAAEQGIGSSPIGIGCLRRAYTLHPRGLSAIWPSAVALRACTCLLPAWLLAGAVQCRAELVVA